MCAGGEEGAQRQSIVVTRRITIRQASSSKKIQVKKILFALVYIHNVNDSLSSCTRGFPRQAYGTGAASATRRASRDRTPPPGRGAGTATRAPHCNKAAL